MKTNFIFNIFIPLVLFTNCSKENSCEDKFLIQKAKGRITIIDSNIFEAKIPYFVDTTINDAIWVFTKQTFCNNLLSNELPMFIYLFNLPKDSAFSYSNNEINTILNGYLRISGKNQDNGYYQVINGKIDGKVTSQNEWEIKGQINVTGNDSKKNITLVF